MKFNGILKQKYFKEIATLLKCMNFTYLFIFIWPSKPYFWIECC
jgi:hypothetical protein